MVDGQYHKLGYYDTQADNLTWFNNEQWVGGKVKLIVIEGESLSRPPHQGEREPSLLAWMTSSSFYDPDCDEVR